MVWTAGCDGRPDFVSERWLRYTGLTREAMRSRPDVWLSVLHPDDRERIARAIEGARAADTECEFTARIRCWDDGGFHWHSFHWLPIRDGTEDVCMHLMVCTEAVGFEASEARAVVRRDELDAAIHHLRNLVSPIAVAASLLRAPESSLRTRACELIDRQVDRIVEALISLERIAEHETALHPEGKLEGREGQAADSPGGDYDREG